MGDDSAMAEALLTKEMAENKIQTQDYTDARILLLKAHQIFPKLEHVTGMLSVCDVLCAAQIELPSCGIDWYWVIQLFPTADAPTIESQYQNLTSLLEPIKMDFPGTETALKFIQDAYSVLSDPVKRAAFDSKRNSCGNDYDVNSQAQCGVEIGNVAADAAHVRTVMGSCSDSPSSSRHKRSVHEACEESRRLEGLVETCVVDKQKKKICSKEGSLVSTQMRSEGNASVGTDLVDPVEQHCCSPPLAIRKRPKSDYYDFETNRKAELFSMGQIWVAFDLENMPRCYALVNKIIPRGSDIELYVTWLRPSPASSNEKSWSDAGFPVVCGSFVLESTKQTSNGRMMFSHLFSKGVTRERFEIYPQKGEAWAIYRDWNVNWCSNPGMRNGCGFEVVEILTNYLKDAGVRVAYLAKVDGFRNVFQRCTRSEEDIPADKLFMFSHYVPMYRFKGGEIGGVENGMLELDPLAMPDNLVRNFSCAIVSLRETQELTCSDEASASHLPIPLANTTDTSSSAPGIQNHKPKWSAKDFTAEQVWAVYDGPDAMPRLYVKVMDVISPNIVSVTFLEPHPMLDEEIQWVEESLPFVCGIFRGSRATTNMNMKRFSHLVKCDRSLKKSFYRIFPRKGEIWAMYKNWNINWKHSDLRRYQCRIVEILSNVSEESGISVCSLVEVEGYLTFFQRQLYEDFQLTRQISRREMLSFSNRIPAFTMIGASSHGIPKGSWHLEPDALPPKFN